MTDEQTNEPETEKPTITTNEDGTYTLNAAAIESYRALADENEKLRAATAKAEQDNPISEDEQRRLWGLSVLDGLTGREGTA